MAYKEYVRGDTVNNGTASRVVAKLTYAQDDVRILIMGDSIAAGQGATYWPWMLVTWLATQYPAYTWKQQWWNNTNGTYDAPASFNTGTSSRIATIYNFSANGAGAQYGLASRFALGVTASNADLVIVVVGLNESTVESETMANLLSLTQSVSDVLPDAQIVMVTPNPRTDTGPDVSLITASFIRRVAARFNYLVAEVLLAFRDDPSFATTLMDPDGIHPLTAGHTVYFNVMKRLFINRRDAIQLPQSESSFSGTDVALIRNGRFSRWSAGTAAAPDYWVRTGTGGSIAQGTTLELSNSPARLTTASTGNVSTLMQTLDTQGQAQVKGRMVTVAARVFVPSSITIDSQIKTQITWTGGSFQSLSLQTGSGTGFGVRNGYMWQVIQGIVPTSAPNDVAVGVTATSSSGAVDVTIDRISAVVGNMPREYTPHFNDYATFGYQPYAYSIGGGPTLASGTTVALAVSGGTVAIPVVLDGNMLLNSVSVWTTDTTLTRGGIEFALYQDLTDNANAIPLVTGAVGTLASWTAAAAAERVMPVTTPPVFLSPGPYWLVVKNNGATNAVTVGATAIGGFTGQDIIQTKTLTTSAFGATLDLVAATWTKTTALPLVRLNGRSFGQSTAF